MLSHDGILRSTFVFTVLIHAATMSATRAESDYGSDFGDSAEIDVIEVLDDFSSGSQVFHSSHHHAVANLPSLLAMPTVLLDHDQDEYGWRDGEVEILEDDAGIALLPRESNVRESEEGGTQL